MSSCSISTTHVDDETRPTFDDDNILIRVQPIGLARDSTASAANDLSNGIWTHEAGDSVGARADRGTHSPCCDI